MIVCAPRTSDAPDAPTVCWRSDVLVAGGSVDTLLTFG
jgi:hypothetical protein